MPDLSHLSDDQLAQIASGKPPKASPDLSHLSDDELSKIASQAKMGAGQAATIQGQSGALLGLRPVVAGAGSAMGDIAGQWDNFKKGRGINLAQTKDAFVQGRSDANAEQTQASQDHPYISGGSKIAGSLLTLPLLPAKGLAGAVKLGIGLGAAEAAGSANSLAEAGTGIATGGLLSAGGYGLAKGIGAAANVVGSSPIAQAMAQKTKDFGKGLLTKLPSELTGISDKEIEAYSTRADKVTKIFKDSEGDASLAAKHAKENILQDVQRARSHLNDQIGQALSTAPTEATIDASPIIQRLEAEKQNLHPIYGKKDVSAIDGIINDIKGASTDGKLSVQDLQKTKSYLYDSAKGSYSEGGQIFPIGKDAARAAKTAGRAAKELMDDLGPPEIKNANRQLQQLHEIEDHMGNNLLNPNAKSHSDIYAVGSGATNNNSQALTDLGNITGKNYLQDATDLSAARTFGKAPLFPPIKTGRALIGPVVMGSLGGGAGAFLGGAPGAYMGTKIGAGFGAVLSSPAALKAAINTGQITGQALSKLGLALGINPQNIDQVYNALQAPQAQQILMRAMGVDQSAAKSNIIKTRAQLEK